VVLPFGAHGAWQAAGRPHLMLLALGTAVLASVVPYTLELAALRRAPRRVFGTLLSLEPAVAALAGLVLLGQPVPPAAAGAIALVILASAGATVGARPPAAATGGAEGAAPVLDDVDDEAERERAAPATAGA
jgi:inner membrane transporter RhtA